MFSRKGYRLSTHCWLPVWMLLIGTALTPMVANAQHSIVLRDLTFIQNVQIETMTVDGMTLVSGQRYSWSVVLQGDVGDKQAEFDQYIKTIGLPLFRLRARMANGDYVDLQPVVDQLLPLINASDTETRYTVLAAMLHSRLERGARVPAVIPLLEILRLRSLHSELAGQDNALGLRFDDDGICLNLLPVWFDTDAARKANDQVRGFEQSLVNQESSTRPTIHRDSAAAEVYIQSLYNVTVTEGQSTAQNTPSVAKLTGWVALLSAQSALFNGNHSQVIETLGKPDLNLNAHQQAIALYYQGLALHSLAKPESDPKGDQWILAMLQIPASYQARFPELSAAAIYQVVTDPQVSSQTKSLASELTGRFSDTYYGRRYQQGRN